MVKVKTDMQNDNQTNPDTSANSGDAQPPPPSLSGGQKVIQPTPGLVQELQAQQQQQSMVVSSDIPQPTKLTTPPQSVYPQPSAPTDGQMQAGMSASQMSWSQSSNKSRFDVKKLITKGVIGLVVGSVIFVVLVFTNIIALSQFKTVDYTDSKGTHYSLTFYTKHTTGTGKSGITSLVSKVSKGGKYPLVLSIVSGSISNLDKNGIKTCNGPWPKVFDVQNSNLNQQISVCSLPMPNDTPDGVYVMAFAANDQAHIVTISQDLAGIDLSSQSAAQQSLLKTGLGSYQDDIKTIVASIKVK